MSQKTPFANQVNDLSGQIVQVRAQARGAAVRAVSLLSRDELDATPITASINPRLCAACGLCVEICPYDARVLEPGAPHSEVIDVLCQGCGACIAACPNKASQQKDSRWCRSMA